MFGWDWGPQLPDAGIWRDLSIKGYQQGRLEDVYITQHHQCDQVVLDCQVRITGWGPGPFAVEGTITAPDGRRWSQSILNAADLNQLSLRIDQPQLWWPNGYGEQPLYRVEVLLKDNADILDSRQLSIGLRTLTVQREKDQWGESFAFNVNGVAIFAMGANLIPEDSILPRRSPERTERLIQDCVAANFNCIRVWGGGIYPEDYFYDFCDQYGLIVWQDLMYACAVYALTDEFAANIRKEAIDNMQRIRHHACLGIWCGNNEMEQAWVEWGLPKTGQLRTDYIKQFEVLLPEVAKATDPNTFYWPASPSSGGNFDDPNCENRGDAHYWEVWHGLKPFTEYRKHYFRFVSEFGFQSFPSLATVESFTLPEDRNIFSYVMEQHQKNKAANGKILYYLSENFLYPKDFDSLLYTSQILQAEAIKYGVEHWRRHRGRCMGAIYWQLNDCWPVASWSSIDYYGRWKALHYFARRFFAPVLLSACEEGTRVGLYVTNDSWQTVPGEIIWKLRDNYSRVLQTGTCSVTVDPLTAKQCAELDFSDRLPGLSEQRRSYLEFALRVGGATVSAGTVLFVKEKHFEFVDPGLRVDLLRQDGRLVVTVKSKAFAKFVELGLGEIDARFSDNYFDLSAGEEQQVIIEKLSRPAELAELKARLTARSIFEIV
jgi:beta-mannosidase